MTPERELLTRLARASDHLYEVVLCGPLREYAATEHWASIVNEARILLGTPQEPPDHAGFVAAQAYGRASIRRALDRVLARPPEAP